MREALSVMKHVYGSWCRNGLLDQCRAWGQMQLLKETIYNQSDTRNWQGKGGFTIGHINMESYTVLHRRWTP